VKKRILLVDDSDLMRGAVRNFLQQRLPSCEFLEAGDGKTGVEVARKHRPDVVIMDIRMPGVSGIEATRQIKLDRPNTAVVMFTLSDNPKQRQAARQAGACAYVLKDSGPEELAKVVRRFARGQRRRKGRPPCML